MKSDREDLEAYILDTWGSNHKKSAYCILTLMIINDRNSWTGGIQKRLEVISQGNLCIDSQNLQRLLRRLEGLELISADKLQPGGSGAPRKYYSITESGRSVLRNYCESTLSYLSSHEFTALMERACECERVDGQL